MIYFSQTTCSFYPSELLDQYESSGTLPDDLIEITEEETDLYFCKTAPDGKIIGSMEGHPSWVDLPEKTGEESAEIALSQISKLLAIASVKIAPLQDAVDLDIATDDEIALLTAWKTYRVLVNRVTSQTGYPDTIEWPEQPE